MKLAATLLSVVLLMVTAAQEPPAPQQAAINFETVFTAEEIDALNRLIGEAALHDSSVIDAQRLLDASLPDAELLKRLSDSLTVNAGAAAAGSFYGQVEPRYSISVSLDVMRLLEHPESRSALQAGLTSARAQSRVAVVEAFVRHKVALESAEAASVALESAEAAFGVAADRLEVGEGTLSEQMSAKSAVASAAIAVLSANGEVIVALESLASVVGVTPQRVQAMLEPEGVGETNE